MRYLQRRTRPLILPLAPSGGGEGIGHGYTVTHYADPAASGGGDGSQGNPWTPMEAFANATTPGMRVEHAPGIGNVNNSGMGLHPAASGTSSDPIIHVAKYPAVHNLGNSSLWTQIVATGTNSRHCFSNNILTGGNRQYIIIDGFRTYQGVDNLFNGGGHHVALHNNSGLSQYWKFRRLLMDQELYAPSGTVAELGGDNYGAFWTQGSENVEISDCIMRNFYGSTANLTIWTMYGARNSGMHHCRAENVSAGPYIKGNQASGWNAPMRFDHNIVKNTRFANVVPNVAGEVSGTPYADIFQNIFIAESGYAIGFRSPGAPSSDNPLSVRSINNTFVGLTGHTLALEGNGVDGIWTWADLTSGVTQGSGCYNRNNIYDIVKSIQVLMGGSQNTDATGVARIDSDRNLYPSAFENNFGTGGDSKATWTGTSGREGNSEFGTPTFVDSGNEDYRLQSGSDGEDIGTDILDLLGGGTSAAINAGAEIGDGSTFGPRSAAAIAAASIVWAYPFE